MSLVPINFAKIEPQAGCVSPDIGALFSAFMVDLLSDSEIVEFEEHLLLCRFCRENFLKILSLKVTAQAMKANANQEQQIATSSARVLQLADFKKSTQDG